MAVDSKLNPPWNKYNMFFKCLTVYLIVEETAEFRKMHICFVYASQKACIYNESLIS